MSLFCSEETLVKRLSAGLRETENVPNELTELAKESSRKNVESANYSYVKDLKPRPSKGQRLL